MPKVIHPNRWFFWTIAILFAAALGLLIVIQQFEGELDYSDCCTASVQNNERTYKSETLGFSVNYPRQWQIEIDREEPHTVYLEDPNNYAHNITISVVSPRLESVIRSSLKAAQEISLEVGGIKAKKLINGNLKDQAAANVILLSYGKRLYYIAGPQQELDKIISSFKILESK